MSGFFILDEPFEGDRAPTADDLRRATPLPGVTSWEWSADPDDDPDPGFSWLRPGARVEVHEVAGGYVVLPDETVAPDIRADLTAAMQSVDLQLTPWQQRIAEVALDPRRSAITYPKQNGRGAISRVMAEALNGDPMPSSPSLVITLEPAVATFWDRLEHLARESRSDPKGRRHRRVKVEQRRIRQAMRHIERRAARRQRRAASRAARGVTR